MVYLSVRSIYEIIRKMINAEDAERTNDLTTTDALILEELADGRNVPSNIADEIDRTRHHVGTRLDHLRSTGVVRRVGRENISLHEITDDGRRVLDAYQQFRAAIDEREN